MRLSINVKFVTFQFPPQSEQLLDVFEMAFEMRLVWNVRHLEIQVPHNNVSRFLKGIEGAMSLCDLGTFRVGLVSFIFSDNGVYFGWKLENGI